MRKYFFRSATLLGALTALMTVCLEESPAQVGGAPAAPAAPAVTNPPGGGLFRGLGQAGGSMTPRNWSRDTHDFWGLHSFPENSKVDHDLDRVERDLDRLRHDRDKIDRDRDKLQRDRDKLQHDKNRLQHDRDAGVRVTDWPSHGHNDRDKKGSPPAGKSKGSSKGGGKGKG